MQYTLITKSNKKNITRCSQIQQIEYIYNCAGAVKTKKWREILGHRLNKQKTLQLFKILNLCNYLQIKVFILFDNY